MKTVLIVLLLVAFFVGAGYYGLPIVVEKETSGLKSEIGDLKQRLQKTEEFMKNEEEARKVTVLQPDSGGEKIIRAVNSLASRVASIENALNNRIAATDESIKKQRSATEEALKKQTETIDKLNKETQANLQKILFDAAIANVRGHIAKARTDLLSKNIATAKTELELVGSIFDTLKTSVSNENKKIIEELATTLKKARSEVDADLPAAVNRVDVLWHDMSKLLRKS